MKVVYVSGPYSAPCRSQVWDNCMRARAVTARLFALGVVPICPHLNSLFMDGPPLDYETFLKADEELVLRSDAILMIGAWGLSAGAVRERECARRAGHEVFLLPEGPAEAVERVYRAVATWAAEGTTVEEVVTCGTAS